MSLRKKLMLSMVAIAAIPVIVLGSFCYQYFSGVLLSNVQTRELQNNDQIIYSMENFFNSLYKISDALVMNEELLDILQRDYSGQGMRLQQYRDHTRMEQLLYRNGYYLDSRIETVAVFPENSHLFYYCSNGNVNSSYHVKEEEWYGRISRQEGAQTLIGVNQNHLLLEDKHQEERYYVTIGRNIYSAYESELLGTILININVQDLQELWPRQEGPSQEIFFLVDDENNVVLSSRKEEIGSPFLWGELQPGVSSCQIDGNQYDAMVSVSREFGWKSVKMIPRGQLNQEIAAVPYFATFLALILVGLAVLAALFFSYMITRPLQELYVRLRRFGAEKNGLPLPESQVGVKGLSNSYNRMLDQLTQLTEKNYETEARLRQAELMALQSQISPHFIYNTLNSIKWMADMQGSKRMVTALDSLIKLMQFSSKNSQEFIRIQDEIDLIRDYINLINLKHFDRVSARIHVEPGVERYETLRFLLQPIVENSVYHGFAQVAKPCEVTINISRKGGSILYEVIDNGRGMSQEKIKQALEKDYSLNSHSFNKIGLYNVNKRIQYTFGPQYGIQIESQPGVYTRVKVEIPARLYREDQNENR